MDFHPACLPEAQRSLFLSPLGNRIRHVLLDHVRQQAILHAGPLPLDPRYLHL